MTDTRHAGASSMGKQVPGGTGETKTVSDQQGVGLWGGGGGAGRRRRTLSPLWAGGGHAGKLLGLVVARGCCHPGKLMHDLQNNTWASALQVTRDSGPNGRTEVRRELTHLTEQAHKDSRGHAGICAGARVRRPECVP